MERKMSTPYIGFSNDSLERLPRVARGDFINCPKCGAKHALEGGTVDDKESDLLLFYKCGKSTFLGAVDGRLTIGQKADVHGSI